MGTRYQEAKQDPVLEKLEEIESDLNDLVALFDEFLDLRFGESARASWEKRHENDQAE